jgi:hypothetical protein
MHWWSVSLFSIVAEYTRVFKYLHRRKSKVLSSNKRGCCTSNAKCLQTYLYEHFACFCMENSLVKFVQPFIYAFCIAETLNFYVVVKVVQTGYHYGEYTIPIFSGHRLWLEHWLYMSQLPFRQWVNHLHCNSLPAVKLYVYFQTSFALNDMY